MKRIFQIIKRVPDGKTPEGLNKSIRVEELVTAETMSDVLYYIAPDLTDEKIEVETIHQIGYRLADIQPKQWENK